MCFTAGGKTSRNECASLITHASLDLRRNRFHSLPQKLNKPRSERIGFGGRRAVCLFSSRRRRATTAPIFFRETRPGSGGGKMLWTVFVILLVMWLLGMVTSYTLGG